MSLWGIRPDFSGLSPCYRQIAYVLLTRAPVAARSIATPALPLDLHVLGLSLAFILSQDQTLRCISCFYFFFPSKSAPAEIDFLLYFACTTLASFQSFNDLASRFPSPLRCPSLEKRCKGTPFFPFLPNFLSTFLCYTTYFFLNALIDTPLLSYFFY